MIPVVFKKATSLNKDFKSQEIARRAVKGRQMPTPDKFYYGKTEIRYNSQNASQDEILAYLKKNHFPKNHTPIMSAKNLELGDVFIY